MLKHVRILGRLIDKSGLSPNRHAYSGYSLTRPSMLRWLKAATRRCCALMISATMSVGEGPLQRAAIVRLSKLHGRAIQSHWTIPGVRWCRSPFRSEQQSCPERLQCQI